MTNEYTLKDALNYRDRIGKLDDYVKLDTIEFNKAIKFFADNGDKTNFKKMTDRFLTLIKDAKYEPEEIKENPLSFLEFLCAGMDKSFTIIGYSGVVEEGVEPGNAQKLLREMYKIGE